MPDASASPSPDWPRVAEVFDAVSSAAAPTRAALLDALTTGDAGLRREVESLLAALDRAPDAFEGKAVETLTSPPLTGPGATLVEGTRLGPWLIVRRIAEGGMGTVYEATRADDAYEGRVAIKTLARGALDEASQRRFRQERQILASLQHPHIAALIDGGTTAEGLPYLVMEYVDGEPIDAWCDARRTPIAARLDLFRQVCDALQYAHRQLVVHRDLKPSNILVTADGAAKVVDFGIAKLLDDDGTRGHTTEGLVPLTLAYASPEQARGEAISTVSDVYSLGVVLHRLLAGGSPYPRDAVAPLQLAAALLQGEPLLPSATATDHAARLRGLSGVRTLREALERELDAIVLMALRKEPERRYASVAALDDDLHRFLRGLPVTARPDTMSYRVRKFVQRQRALVAGVTVGALALGVGTTVALSERRQALAEAARAERISAFMQTVLGSGDPRLGTGGVQAGAQATVEDLLAGATTRVSREFADDPHVRGRLFTAIGSALITRSSMVRAAPVLDSAIVLLRASYGPGSPEYAFANLEASQAAVYRNRIADAERYVAEGLRVVQVLGRTDDLAVRAMRDHATILLASGRIREADTVVRRALATEATLHTTPTLQRAALLNRLVNTTAWLGGMARADSVARLAVAAYTASGAGFTMEEADIVHNAASTAMSIGQVARADSLCTRGQARLNAVLGGSASQVAVLEECIALLAFVRRDSASARRHLERALFVVDSIPESSALLRNELIVTLGEEAIARGEWRRADSIAVRAHEGATRDGRWLVTVPAKLLLARTRGTLRDFRTSERLFLEVAHLVDSTGGLEPIGTTPAVRLDLARLYTLLGPKDKADSLVALLPPELRGLVKPWADWYRTHKGLPPGMH